MEILALDIATKTGWATSHTSGVVDFKPKRGESDGMRVVRFRSWLDEMLRSGSFSVVVYERPAGRHAASIIVAAKMVGMVDLLAHEHGLDVAIYSASEIKKHATGKGNAGKDQVYQAAVEKWGTGIADDNEADALWLHDLASKDLILP
jgi:Holliday junction resolvasome RuvABC endonuclease subunit